MGKVLADAKLELDAQDPQEENQLLKCPLTRTACSLSLSHTHTHK